MKYVSKYNNKNLFANKLLWFVVLLTVLLIIILPTKLFVFIPLVAIHIFFSWLRNKSGTGWLGVELILFNTVLAGMLLGALGGMIMAGLCLLINYLFSGKYVSYFFVTLPLYLVIGGVSSFIAATSIVITGIIITLIYNILSFLLSLSTGARPFGLIAFTITNIIFNVLLFMRIGPLIVKAIL